jgi:hypothetical protein
MSKVIRTAAVIVGAVALIATGIGAAAGAGILGTSIAGVSAATVAGVAGTVGTVASVTAGALSLAAIATAKAPPLSGTAQKFIADPNAGIPYAIGRIMSGGNIVYRRTHNSGGSSLPDLQTFVAVLSGAGPIDAIEAFQADKVTTSFSGKNAVGTYATWMFQHTQLGATPEAAQLTTGGLSVGGSRVTSTPPGWGTSNRLSGMAAAMWTLRFDTKGKQYANGIPQPSWVIRGVRVYDPRLDSTYPGGSGACRALNEATYVYSNNPYLHALTWALGRYQNGKQIMGIGAPVAGIDVAAFVEGANVAQANGWTAAGIVRSTDDKWDVMKVILQAGSGRPIHLGAQISCLVDTPRTVLATVTTSDVVGEASVTATQARRDRINTIIPRYMSEAHGWQFVAASPVSVASHVTTDGGERRKEVTYSMATAPNHAATLARYEIENSREFGPIVIPLKLRWMGYRPGDCIAVTLPEVGLNAQAVIVTSREIDAGGAVVTLTARSETNAKHAFALGQTATAPPTPGVTAPPVAPQPAAGAWSIAGTSLVAGASTTPAIIVTGSAGDVPIDGVVFEYRLWVSGQGADVGWIGAGADLPNVARKEITALLPGTQYEVAVSYRLGPFNGERRIIGPATTAGVGVPWAGVGGTGRPDDNATYGDNLIKDGGLANGIADWSLPAGFARAAASAGMSSVWAIRTTTGAGQTPFTGFPVTAGRRLFFSMQVFLAGPSRSIGITVRQRDAANNIIASAFNGGGLVAPGVSTLRQDATLLPNCVAVEVFFEVPVYGGGHITDITSFRASYTEPGADVTTLQPVVSRLSPATGQAEDNFVLSTGLAPAQVVRSGVARDGDVVTFSPALPRSATIIFLPGGNSGTAGQNLRIVAEGNSATGFTLRAKTQAVTPGSGVSDTGATSGGAGEPDLVMNRSNSGAPFDGGFTFTITVTVGEIAPGEPGRIEVGLFVRQSGVWQQRGVISASATSSRSAIIYPGTVDFGAGNEFGVDVISATGTGTVLNSFDSVGWTLGTVTETSLTPSGASGIPWLALL